MGGAELFGISSGVGCDEALKVVVIGGAEVKKVVSFGGVGSRKNR